MRCCVTPSFAALYIFCMVVLAIKRYSRDIAKLIKIMETNKSKSFFVQCIIKNGNCAEGLQCLQFIRYKKQL